MPWLTLNYQVAFFQDERTCLMSGYWHQMLEHVVRNAGCKNTYAMMKHSSRSVHQQQGVGTPRYAVLLPEKHHRSEGKCNIPLLGRQTSVHKARFPAVLLLFLLLPLQVRLAASIA